MELSALRDAWGEKFDDLENFPEEELQSVAGRFHE
jgi:hypothetical protein